MSSNAIIRCVPWWRHLVSNDVCVRVCQWFSDRVNWWWLTRLWWRHWGTVSCLCHCCLLPLTLFVAVSVGQLVSQLTVSRLVGWSVSQSVDYWSVDHWSIGWPLVSWSVSWPSVSWLTIGPLVSWVIGWPLVCYLTVTSRSSFGQLSVGHSTVGRSVSWSVCRSLSLTVFLYVWLSVCLSVFPAVCLFACLPVSLCLVLLLVLSVFLSSVDINETFKIYCSLLSTLMSCHYQTMISLLNPTYFDIME